ncbi:hypothetical protein QBC39DRAFT_382541 [Podospora conica]|nr:hypothetical protein QBC39DRAFT_382541 [Schizothecium conicum]
MFSPSTVLPLAALLTLVHGHGVILGAQGLSGSPLSVGFQVNEAIARNCTTINPCQMDATIIRDAEILANVVNKCGRTELTGNIDIGENTENALAANQVTQVKAGSDVVVTIHQVNADGAGPYVCDIDMTSNGGIISQNLTVTNNIPGVNGLSQAKAQDFNITVTMPSDMQCTGASTGDICTIRCRNNAVAGPFGGCFAVQQTDITPKVNTPENISTGETAEEIAGQVAQNQKDLPAAIRANQNAGGTEAQQNVAAVEALLGTPASQASPVQTPVADNGGPAGGAVVGAAPAETTEATAGGGGNGKGNGRGGGGGFRNGGGRNQRRSLVGPDRRFVVVDFDDDE